MTPADRLALADRVRARLDRREQTARAATPAGWVSGDVVVYDSNYGLDGYEFCAVTVARTYDQQWVNVASGGVVRSERVEACAPRLVLRDGHSVSVPATVLAEVAAARRLLDLALTGTARAEAGLRDTFEPHLPLEPGDVLPARAQRHATRYAAALADADEALADLDTTYGGQP